MAIPYVDDAWKLAQKVQASFKIPWVRCQVLWVDNDYSAPPTPKCINRKAFLPVPDPELPCQDYREGPPQKTLAYAQALQYWTEKANLPGPGKRQLLARCV